LSIQLNILKADTSVIQSGLTLTSQANGASYQWLDCNSGTLVQGATDSSFTPSISGIYAVIVTQNGCTDTSRCYPVIGINIEESLNDQLTIYPNPTRGALKIESEIPIMSVVLIDLPGHEVFRSQPQRAKSELTLDLEGLDKGIYLVKVYFRDRFICRKIVIW
jgi:hypothetical protein